MKSFRRLLRGSRLSINRKSLRKDAEIFSSFLFAKYFTKKCEKIKVLTQAY